MSAKRIFILAISLLILTACEKNINGEQRLIESITSAEEQNDETDTTDIEFSARLATETETELIDKVKAVINEKNYFSKDGTDPFYIGCDVPYEIYADENNYYVLYGDSLVYGKVVMADAFTKYDKNLYYIGLADYTKAEKVCSGSFFIENITKPDYHAVDNPKVTLWYNYTDVISSVKENFSENHNEFFAVYLLDRYPWDKSEQLLYVMIIDKDDNVCISPCALGKDGFRTTFKDFRFHTDEYPELVKKYKDTAVYFDVHIPDLTNP